MGGCLGWESCGAYLMCSPVIRTGVSDEVRKHLLLSGRVQGVWFRGSTRSEAERIGGLKGFVRNLDDGRVECVVQGPPEKVDALVDWCHKGPDGARVDGAQVVDEDPVPGERPFRVEH